MTPLHQANPPGTQHNTDWLRRILCGFWFLLTPFDLETIFRKQFAPLCSLTDFPLGSRNADAHRLLAIRKTAPLERPIRASATQPGQACRHIGPVGRGRGCAEELFSRCSCKRHAFPHWNHGVHASLLARFVFRCPPWNTRTLLNLSRCVSTRLATRSCLTGGATVP